MTSGVGRLPGSSGAAESAAWGARLKGTVMRTPMKPVPEGISRWVARLPYLRWLDALAAWLVLWGAAARLVPSLPLDQGFALALVLVVIGRVVPSLRVRWRPISGAVGVMVSRRLRAGDRAWYVRARQADMVVVTARHGFHLSIAIPDATAEGMNVRRTRVLLLPVA